MSRLRYLVLFILLSPAIITASIAGYREWARDGFEDPKLPEWFDNAKKPGDGPKNFMEKVKKANIDPNLQW
jgi:hypothetical protein